MNMRRSVLLMLGSVAAFAACTRGPAESARGVTSATAPPTLDSASLARAALDTVNHAAGFISEVLRYELHGDSVRIVTIPDQRRNIVIDGMAVIWLRLDGRILRLAFADSA